MKPIRIGTSLGTSSKAVDENFYVAEVRRHWYENPYFDYKVAAKKCIDNGVYLIFNQCNGHNRTVPHPEFWTTDRVEMERIWRSRIEEDVQLLFSLGGNKNNCRMTLINEVTKFFRTSDGHGGVSDLIWLTNLAHDQIAGRLELGSGNMEFYDAMVLGDWYRYLCRDGNFEWLDIHIQNSCDTDSHTREYTDYAKGLADMYGKKLACTESTHTKWNVAGSGYPKVLMQLSHAERIGCADFCPICLNRDSNAVLQEIDASQMEDEPCFRVDGYDRSNGNYADLKRIADEKHPVPNIKEVFEMYGIEMNYVKPGCHNEECRAAQQVMIDQGYDLSPFGADSWYGDVTKGAIDKWQVDNGLVEDSIIGKETWQWIMENIDTGMLRFMQMLARTGRYK